MATRSSWAWLYRLPVRRTDQMVLAEALAQALGAGLEVSAALAVAGHTHPNPRLRAAVLEAATNCRGGYPLAQALARTGLAVSGELLAALDAGGARGAPAEHLSAFAARCHPRPAARLAVALGRPPEAGRFAAALARLLAEHPLTVGLIGDAGRLAAGDGSKFAAAAERVAEAVRDGTPFPDALAGEPAWFDPLFRALVRAADTRDRTRAVLERLGAS